MIKENDQTELLKSLLWCRNCEGMKRRVWVTIREFGSRVFDAYNGFGIGSDLEGVTKEK